VCYTDHESVPGRVLRWIHSVECREEDRCTHPTSLEATESVSIKINTSSSSSLIVKKLCKRLSIYYSLKNKNGRRQRQMEKVRMVWSRTAKNGTERPSYRIALQNATFLRLVNTKPILIILMCKLNPDEIWPARLRICPPHLKMSPHYRVKREDPQTFFIW